MIQNEQIGKTKQQYDPQKQKEIKELKTYKHYSKTERGWVAHWRSG